MTATEIKDITYALQSEIKKSVDPRYEKLLAALGKEPFFFGLKAYKEKHAAIVEQYRHEPLVQELHAIQAQCPHRISVIESHDGPFNTEQCEICGYSRTYMLSYGGQ